jgi:hypothetical protein
MVRIVNLIDYRSIEIFDLLHRPGEFIDLTACLDVTEVPRLGDHLCGRQAVFDDQLAGLLPAGDLVLTRKPGGVFGQGQQLAEILLPRLGHPGPEAALQRINGSVVLTNRRFEIQDHPVMPVTGLARLPGTLLLSQPMLSDCLVKGGPRRFLSPRMPGLAAHQPGQGARRRRREILPHRDRQRLTEFAWVKWRRFRGLLQLGERQPRRTS